MGEIKLPLPMICTFSGEELAGKEKGEELNGLIFPLYPSPCSFADDI